LNKSAVFPTHPTKKKKHHQFFFRNPVDYVVISAKGDLSDPVSQKLLKLWYDEGGIAKQYPSLRKYLRNSMYKVKSIVLS